MTFVASFRCVPLSLIQSLFKQRPSNNFVSFNVPPWLLGATRSLHQSPMAQARAGRESGMRQEGKGDEEEEDEDVHKDFPLMGRSNTLQAPMERAEVKRCLRLMPTSPWMQLHETPAQAAMTSMFTRPKRSITRTLMSPLIQHAGNICEEVIIESVESSFDMQDFLEGAGTALQTTLELFGSGDYDRLRGLLGSKLLAEFRASKESLESEHGFTLDSIKAEVHQVQPACTNLWRASSVEQFDPMWAQAEAGSHLSRSWLVLTVSADCTLKVAYKAGRASGSSPPQNLLSMYKHGHVLFARGPLPRGQRQQLQDMPWKIIGML